MKVKLKMNLDSLIDEKQAANHKAVEWLNEHGYNVHKEIGVVGQRYATCDVRMKDLKILVKEIGVCPEVYC